MNKLMGEVKPFKQESVPPNPASIRKFVKDIAEITENIKDAKADLKEAIENNDEVQDIDDQIKALREQRKEVIASNAAIQTYKSILDDVMEDKRQIISDAKDDGVPKKEIDLAIKALKNDIDMTISTEVYMTIADLVE